jgi:aspartyl-tRNA(Asn)/glutamyl-tRNA(Gln) amidotransferase subunit A
MAGFDSRDSTSLDTAVPDYLSTLNTGLENVRLGIPKEFLDPSIDAEVLSAIETALQEFEKLGAKLVDIELPNSGAGIAAFYVIAPAEASSNLSRFDGVRYGHRTPEFDDLLDMYEKSRAEGFGDEVKRRILIGTYALSAGYYDAYYLKAQKVRRIIANDFNQAFKQCDLIAGPTTPSTAFALGENLDDPVSMYLNDVFTVPANLAGLPAISLPAGFDQSGLPIGLQLTGPYLKEANILAAAHGYQKVTDWHQRIPGDYE